MWSLLLLAALAPQDVGAVDARLDELVTLDSYHPFVVPSTADEWAARRDALRRRVRLAAGLWPALPPAPMTSVVHGTIERDGYVVEKVRVEVLEGFWMTGNLYRPTGVDGRRPAVLSPHGHWANGRFTEVAEDEARRSIERGEERFLANARYPLQARCALLARLGCVVLHYDMIGYADARQLDHAQGFGDVEAELFGLSHFGLQTLTSIRALDWLVARDDVDPARIAVTGASGGGTQTFVLGAIDERPAVLFPAVMVSTAMQGGCVCENASGLRLGTGNVELAALAAPRPLGLTGANDWTLEIGAKGLPELKRLYAMLGAPDRVEAWCYPTFPHNYNAVSRARMAEWLARFLDLGPNAATLPIVEPELVPVAPEALAVYDDAHPRPGDLADLARVRAMLLGFARARADALLALAAEDPPAFRSEVGAALETIVAPRSSEETARLDVSNLATESDARSSESIDHVSPAGAGHRVYVRTRRSRDEAARPLSVLVVAPDRSRAGESYGLYANLDARLVGVVHPLGLDPERASDGEPAREPGVLPVDVRHARYPGYTWGYNRTLLAQRVQDVLTAIAHLRALGDGRPVRLVGLGDGAPAALLAAALAGSAVERVAVAGSWDFDDAVELDDPLLLPRVMCLGGRAAIGALVTAPLLWIANDANVADVASWIVR